MSGYGKRFTEEDLQRVLSKRSKARNRTPVPTTNVEPDSSNGNLAKKKVARLDTPVSLLVHSFRHRLCDSDGLSAKAAIDGVVKAEIIEDDAPQFIEEVRYRQTKIKKTEAEKTLLIFY